LVSGSVVLGPEIRQGEAAHPSEAGMDTRPHNDTDNDDARAGGAALNRGAITVRGPFAWLLVSVMAAPWGVGLYVIIRAVTAYLSRPKQPLRSPPPPRFSQRATAYRPWQEE
jgi:hypothetical protein